MKLTEGDTGDLRPCFQKTNPGLCRRSERTGVFENRDFESGLNFLYLPCRVKFPRRRQATGLGMLPARPTHDMIYQRHDPSMA